MVPHWRINLESVKDVEAALSRGVLVGFCRCFVHADRLTSATSTMYASQKLHGKNSVAFARDLHTMVWFTIGTLRELAHGIRDLRSALHKRGILDPTSEPWVKLRAFEKRWDDNEAFRRLRDKAAFHIDRDVLDRGVDELMKEPWVQLCHGDGPKSINSSLTLGLIAMHNGLGMTLAEYRQFLDSVGGDLGVGQAIQEAFLQAAESSGIPLRRE